MKRLVIKKLIIISPKSQEAKVVEFDSKLTVITGDNPDGTTINRTGKSLVMKCLYYSMGANLKKYTANWHNLQLSTIITFDFDDVEYELYRCGDRFILRNRDGILKFDNIADLREYYVDFFNFKIKLPIKETDEKAVYAYPGSIFMPFYIDQDKGWAGSWDSFSDIFSGKWKTEILLYHMGIRTPLYYSLLDEKVKLELQQKADKQKEQTLTAIIENHITKYGDYLDISFEIQEFENDITALTKELNEQLAEKNAIKEELVKCLNEMNEIESLYSVAQKNYHEMLADMEYVDNNIVEDHIICPICGTSHKNDVLNRFSLYTEISECENTMNAYFSQRSKIEKRIGIQSDKLKSLDVYISKINSILSQKRSSISFHDVIVSEGSRSILEDMRLDLSKVKSSLFKIEERLKEIKNDQSAITKEGKHISDLYLSHLRANLSSLDVTDIDQKDLEKITPSFKSGGNDLPCAILAQIYAIYEVASKYSYTALYPIVLDAIFQQEPAKEKIQTIWDFLINSQPQNSQLIISTTEMHNYSVNGKIITLLTERGLLSIADYEAEKDTIKWYTSVGLEK